MNIRYLGLQILSKLRKDNIFEHYKDIEKFYNSGKKDNKTRINTLLKHAVNNTDFYKPYADKCFFEFPVINKQIILDNYNKFTDKNYDKNIHYMHTSGSTGKKFTIQQDSNKRSRVIAELMYFYEKGHYNLGEKLLYVGTFPEGNSKLKKIKTNITEIDMKQINDEILDSVIEEINRGKYKSILSYTAFHNELLMYIANNDVTVNPQNGLKSIFTNASYCPIQTKIKLEEIFKVPIIDRYSNQECGVLAQTKSTKSSFVVNTASYYIEILKIDSDEPASENELGRIVVTDLYNYNMPLIRYDTGDLAVYQKKSDGLGIEIIKEVHGRVVQSIPIQEGIITTHTLNDFFILGDYNFTTYQCIFSDEELEVRLPLNEKNNVDTSKLLEDVKQLIGGIYKITLNFTDEFERTKSNKFETIIKR